MFELQIYQILVEEFFLFNLILKTLAWNISPVNQVVCLYEPIQEGSIV